MKHRHIPPRTNDGAGKTFVERFVARLPMPYWVGSLVLVGVFEWPSFVLVKFLETSDFDKAVLEPSLLLWQSVVSRVLLNVILPLYALLLIRYIRLRIEALEPEVLPILPEDGATALFSKAFRRISFTWPVLLVALLLAIPTISAGPFGSATGTASMIFVVFSDAFTYLLYGTLVWEFVASIVGIAELSRQPLRTRPYYEDSLLGFRPMGSISLLLSFAYFVAVGIVGVDTLFSPPSLEIQLVALLIPLIVLGVLIFFLPLRSIHRRMSHEKRREEDLIHVQFARLAKPKREIGNNVIGAEDLQKTLALLTDIASIEMIERKVASLPTWPFDTRIRESFLAILLSVIASVVARIILLTLHL